MSDVAADRISTTQNDDWWMQEAESFDVETEAQAPPQAQERASAPPVTLQRALPAQPAPAQAAQSVQGNVPGPVQAQVRQTIAADRPVASTTAQSRQTQRQVPVQPRLEASNPSVQVSQDEDALEQAGVNIDIGAFGGTTGSIPIDGSKTKSLEGDRAVAGNASHTPGGINFVAMYAAAGVVAAVLLVVAAAFAYKKSSRKTRPSSTMRNPFKSSMIVKESPLPPPLPPAARKSFAEMPPLKLFDEEDLLDEYASSMALPSVPSGQKRELSNIPPRPEQSLRVLRGVHQESIVPPKQTKKKSVYSLASSLPSLGDIGNFFSENMRFSADTSSPTESYYNETKFKSIYTSV
ncbi:MAG: hypothetical protein SGCHY_001350 [Lobulomycetales sp.]